MNRARFTYNNNKTRNDIMAINTDPVKLRKRLLPSGLTRLYLDIYVKGRRKTESLHLFLVPETDREARVRNKRTLLLADSIRAKRLVEVRNGAYGFRDDTREGTPLLAYIERAIRDGKGKVSDGTLGTWDTFLRVLRGYDGSPRTTFRDVTPKWIRGFMSYLDRRKPRGKAVGLATVTKRNHMATLRMFLNKARRDGIITGDPMAGIETYKAKAAPRQYLTVEELRRMAANIPPRWEPLCRCFLFSCLTGLRWSDATSITWGEVSEEGGYTRITFTQRKTGGAEYLDITPQAATLMGARKAGESLVFPGLRRSTRTGEAIGAWVRSCGIDKHITFHCARHTFAVMMLDLGVDIYTVSKLLGHRDLATTQIYAKVLDKNKRKAVSGIPDILHTGSPMPEK